MPHGLGSLAPSRMGRHFLKEPQGPADAVILFCSLLLPKDIDDGKEHTEKSLEERNSTLLETKDQQDEQRSLRTGQPSLA